jgi:CubicO group peptidase (beta-lactamase class C family)
MQTRRFTHLSSLALVALLTLLVSSVGADGSKLKGPWTVNVGGEELAADTDDDASTASRLCAHTPQQYEAIVTDMQQRMAAANVPGGAVAIVCNGQLNFAAGVGVKRHQLPDPVTPDTVFRVGSLSKMITAMAALSLVDEHRLNLHQPVTDYVPWFAVQPPYHASSITTHDLLTHRSAIPSAAPISCPTGPSAIEDFFREKNPMGLYGPPARYHNYSNTGYAMGGLVIETVDGRPYDEVVQARVVDRAGMTGATLDPEVAEAADHATGHAVSGGTITATYAPSSYDCGYMHPAGFVFANIRDYGRLAEVLLNRGRGVLRPRSAADMQAPQVWTQINQDGYYGYGLYHDTYKGIDIVWHVGVIPGFQTRLVRIASTRDAVVIFINAGGNTLTPTSVADRALDILYDLGDIPPTDYSQPPSAWQAYEGTYYDPNLYGEIRVEVRGDRLDFDFIDLDWSGSSAQSPIGTFSINPAGLGTRMVNFHRDDDGPAQAIVFWQRTVAERVKP